MRRIINIKVINKNPANKGLWGIFANRCKAFEKTILSPNEKND